VAVPGALYFNSDPRILAQWPDEEGVVTGSGVQTRIVGCLVSGAMGDAYGKKPLKELQA
jgi:hypothetical protein